MIFSVPALGVDWEAFVSRLVSGGGQGFDRYLTYNSAFKHSPNGLVGISLVRAFDHLASAPDGIQALSCENLGLHLNYQGTILKAIYNRW